MKKIFTRTILFLFLLLGGSGFLHAQYNPGQADGTVGLGAFNDEVKTIQVQPDGKVLVGGFFTYYKSTPVNRIVRLNSDGSLDSTFNIGTGANYYIYSIALQSDGKILVGGFFNSFSGVSKNYLVRLNADGSVDNTFNIGTGANYLVYSIVLQPDGKILAGGLFTTFNGVSNKYLVRLNADGSVDNTFNIGTGPNDNIYSIALQPDGKILAGGAFGTFNGLSKNRLVRLNADGSVDNTFNIGLGANSDIYSIVLQTDGKVLTGGYFTSFNGVSNKYLVRLNADGSFDNTFSIGAGANGIIYSIALQPDGEILAGGGFTTFNGVSKNRLVRLNADGSVDNTFNIGAGASSVIEAIALQPDGKVIAGGLFTTFNEVSKNRLVRLNADGSVDNIFNIGAGANYTIYPIALQPDGKILAGG
jgi:uncharacterized delta-60 repeat protein